MIKSIVEEIVIEPFQPGQEEIVAHIHNMAFAEWYATLDPCYRYAPVTPDTVSTWTQHATRAVWVVSLHGSAIGYACCEKERESGQQEVLGLEFAITHADWGQSRIAVLPAYRRNGIAATLLQTILDDFAAKGGDLASACAYNFNPAASALFAKLGFTHQEQYYFTPYSQDDPWRFDAVFAERDLTIQLPPIPDTPELTIRPVREADLPACLTIFHESAPFAFGATPSRQQIAAWFANETSEAIFGAEYNGVLVGMMEYFRDGVIGIPGILPHYRRRGFGTTLLAHLLHAMQQAGHRKAVGDTGVIQQEMMPLYHRFGFDVSKRLFNWVKEI